MAAVEGHVPKLNPRSDRTTRCGKRRRLWQSWLGEDGLSFVSEAGGVREKQRLGPEGPPCVAGFPPPERPSARPVLWGRDAPPAIAFEAKMQPPFLECL